MRRNLLATSVVIAVSASVALADSSARLGTEYGHMGWGGGYGMLGGLMMLVFWGVVIALVVMAVRWFSSGAQTKQEPQDALEILKSRFANGELDEEQYRKRKSVLEE